MRDLITLLWCEVNHIPLDIMNVALLLDGLRAAGVPEDWSLSSSSVRKSRRNQPCGIGSQEFCSLFFIIIMACVINLQRVPNSTNTVRLVTASRLVYGLVNCTHTHKNPYTCMEFIAEAGISCLVNFGLL